MQGAGWAEAESEVRPKSDPGKLALAVQPRQEAALPQKWNAARRPMGTGTRARTRLQAWKNANEGKGNAQEIARSQFEPACD